MHCITETQRKYLASLPLKERQNEILKEEYLNGEWYAADVSAVIAGDIPTTDCWCFGFPCQDISIAGKQRGFDGDRSSLFFRIMGLLKDIPKANKPRYLFIENVKNLLSINAGFDFARVLIDLAAGGYDAEWRVLNSKDYGVPQNRERVFIIGYSRRPGRRTLLPLGESNPEIDELQGHGDIRPLSSEGKKAIANTLCAGDRNQVGCYPIDGGGVLKVNGYHKDSKTMTPVQVAQIYGTKKEPNPQAGRVYDMNGISPCLDTMEGGNRQPKIALPNGKRVKDNGDPMFNLTTQDKHGIMIKTATKEGAEEAHPGDGINLSFPGSETRRGRVQSGGASTLQCNDSQGVVTENLKIRKLTPKECFRLQGWTDDYFEKAEFVNNNSQLYKQAGNGVTVNVIYEIAKYLKTEEGEEWRE